MSAARRPERIDIDGQLTSTAEVLDFARCHPQLINVKEEQLPGIEGSFYSLNYTEEANSKPLADWHPITLRCRGLVIFCPEDAHPYFAILPCPKFFNWPKDGELPEQVRFRRKVDGSCIHAAVVQCPQLTWIVGTRSSLRSPQALLATSFLPAPSQEHLGLTFMMELIDPVTDPHGETAVASGPPGLRLLAAWRDGVKLPFLELDSVLPFLGRSATVVPQEEKPREDFLAAFDQLERASTRDDVREGWVIEDCHGILHKYKSKTWLMWSEVPVANERNVLKVLKAMAKLKKSCPQTMEAVHKYVLDHFSHLGHQKFKKFPDICAAEQKQLEQIVSRVLIQAEANWDAGLSALAAPLESTAGGSNCILERKAAFKVPGAAPFALIAFAKSDNLTVAEFLNTAKENRSLCDVLILSLSWQRE